MGCAVIGEEDGEAGGLVKMNEFSFEAFHWVSPKVLPGRTIVKELNWFKASS
jgi:hypothetical protein